MGRRNNDSLIDLAFSSAWPVSACIAAFFLVVGHMIIPLTTKNNQVLGIVGQGIRPLFSWVAAFFALISLIKWGLSIARRKSTPPHLEPTNSRASRPARRHTHRPSSSRPLATNGGEYRQEPSVFGAGAMEREKSASSAKPTSWSLELIQAVEWKRFEDLCQKFYEAKGIRSAVTPLGPDGGIDIRLYQENSDRVTAIVQCKAWGESYVGVKPIRELLGVMVHEKVEKAFFMTTGKYSDEAKAFATPNRITLIDGTMFLAMLNRLPEVERQSLLTFATAGDYNIPSCPTCGKKMRFIEGKDGKRDFWGCPSFPKCRQKLWARRGTNNLVTAVYQ